MSRNHLYFKILLLVSNFRTFHSYMESKIIGGQFASPNEFPHAVFLHMQCNDEWSCGASIVNQNILLTAAHCIVECAEIGSFDVSVYAGDADFNKQALVRRIKNFIIHNDYKEITVENDIALISLARNLPLNRRIQRVIITRTFPDSNAGTVAGWGITNEETKEISTRLKSVAQKLRNAETCSMLGTLTPGMFCAGSTNPEKSHPAPGDSGSALITENFIEIGLVSFRQKFIPALMVYTNITYYYEWIMDNSMKLYCDRPN